MTDTWTLCDELEAMRRRIEESSPLIARCTLDAQAVTPERGQVHAWLEPPDVDWTMWGEWDTEYTCVLVAGTTATQLEAARLMLSAMTDMQDAGVNLKTARVASWKRSDAGGPVAAYVLTLDTDNTITTTERTNQNG